MSSVWSTNFSLDEESDVMYSDMDDFVLGHMRYIMHEFHLTIPSGTDLQPHNHSPQIYGRITIPLLYQNETFSETLPNWEYLTPLFTSFDSLIQKYAIALQNKIKALPDYRDTALTPYDKALEICQRQPTSTQRHMPLSLGTRAVNPFSCVRISANIALQEPARLEPDTGSCGPWVVMGVFGNFDTGGTVHVPAWGAYGKFSNREVMILREDTLIHNDPVENGKERYQFEFFMPALGEQL